MKSICFIVPYFGKFPTYFPVWLKSCEFNPTVDFLIFTDDHREFDLPGNVKLHYTSFENIQERIQQCFDFKVSISKPYKLCDYKVAYGEIFAKELEEYDFWGYCDIDLIWGDIRSFYTDELLEQYDKIGCQGHATIFRNSLEINRIYKDENNDGRFYKNIFQRDEVCATDVNFIRRRFESRHIKQYTETIYAGLLVMKPGFFLQALPKSLDYQNRHQVFLWEKGVLTRYYLVGGKVVSKPYLYIHFFKRPMKNLVKEWDRVLIYPDTYMNYYDDIDTKCIKRYGTKSYIAFIIRMIRQNKHRLSIKNAFLFIKRLF